jgi:hypothetical protein
MVIPTTKKTNLLQAPLSSTRPIENPQIASGASLKACLKLDRCLTGLKLETFRNVRASRFYKLNRVPESPIAGRLAGQYEVAGFETGLES